MAHNSPLLRYNGFTILEVILVLVLISIFAAIAVTRQPSTNVTLLSQKMSLESHIRYAQMRAMNSDSEWGIAINNNKLSYWLFKNVVTEKRFLPGEDQIEVDLIPKGISISFSPASFSFRFDDWGRPISGGAYLTTELSVDLKKKHGSDMIIETLVITPETGFVR